MNLDDLLRDYARQDLQRFCPAAHYWLRDHDYIADRELTEPMLREPMRFGLTPRERVAATALGNLATYKITSCAILEKANPARDSDDPTPAPGMTFNQEREIWGRLEVFRDSALVYARVLGDAQLIEHYQTPMTAPATDTATPAPVVTDGVLGTPAPEPVADWRNSVRAEAWEQWVKTLAENGTPNLENVAKHLATWCVTNKINGNLGKPPKAGYIKTHVICGRYWAPPRNMSREVAKKHLEQKKQEEQAN